MGLSDVSLNTAADCMTATNLKWFSLHDGDPGATGANEVGTRVAAAWAPAGGSGDTTSGPHLFTGLDPNQPVTHFGTWSAATFGTWGGGSPLDGDQQANSAGEYTLLQAALDGGACP